ncbi:MAG: hypothetical protein ACREJ2_08160 [Planctomycetota bacterium]
MDSKIKSGWSYHLKALIKSTWGIGPVLAWTHRQVFPKPEYFQPKPSISGCTVVRNGAHPTLFLAESIASYAPICREIVLSWDPTSTDDTAGLVRRLAAEFPQIRLVESPWDLAQRSLEVERARQMQLAFAQCTGTWTLYVQPDEALHESDHGFLLDAIHGDRWDGVAFERIAIFQRLNTQIPELHAWNLLRMFRTGLGRPTPDGAHCLLQLQNPRLPATSARLFSYTHLMDNPDRPAGDATAPAAARAGAPTPSGDTAQLEPFQKAMFLYSHPAPIEARFRPAQKKAPAVLSRPRVPRISVHYVARETDAFGTLMFRASLQSLHGYADQIVVVDNGLYPGAQAMLHDLKQELPLQIVDGRAIREFNRLRNLALDHTPAEMDFVHKIDTDEIYLPDGLIALKKDLHRIDVDMVVTNLVHFMIEPTLVELEAPWNTLFRRSKIGAWSNRVHEGLMLDLDSDGYRSPAKFLHFGYCRPQWRILLKWLHYAKLAVGHVDHFKYVFRDGVRYSWFQDGLTPDTILEDRRGRLTKYTGEYPAAMQAWFGEYLKSDRPWREWVASRADPALWQRWQERRRACGNWEDTLEPMLAEYTRNDESWLLANPPSAAPPAT